MYYKLCWQTRDGLVDSQKLATTEECAKLWAKQNNALYDMKHWFEQIPYQQPQIGVMR